MTQTYHSDKPLCGATRFLLVRHGETDWNREQKIQGHVDVPLNSTGLKQASDAADRLARCERDIAAIYSSDLQRARTTAEVIARTYALDVAVDANLREVYMGAAQGLVKAEYDKLFGAARKALDETYTDIAVRWNYSEVPDGEPRNLLIKRLHARMAEIARLHGDKTVIVVTHAGVVRTLILSSVAHDRELFQKYYKHPLANCAVVEFTYADQTCVFKKIHEF